MNLSKHVIKHMARVEVLSDIPGRLRLRVVNYDKIPSKFVDYSGYAKEALCMFKYIEDVSFNTTIGTIVVLYDNRFVNRQTVLRWLDTIIDTAIEHMDEFVSYEEEQFAEAKEKAMELLKAKLEEMMVK